MIELRLTDEQAAVLRRILASEVSDLGMEIADTDSFDYRSGLKRTKRLALELLERLDRNTA
ncbi:MAG TPA: hypothetical protein VD788_12790 [Candidatus Polarisedimenticolaceae bacterium]|nr:hypothetical protein [Candidatus Polarisedimenticolaceae bacterium]